MSAPLRIRPAARALVIDREHRVLLVHFDFVTDSQPTGFWACPGGGIAPGESVKAGLVRELDEELGLSVGDPGRAIWVKEHIFAMTRWDGQHDTYFLVEVDTFEPHPRFSEQELRAEHIDAMRWWGYDELLLAQAVYDAGDAEAEGFTAFSPRMLGHLVRDLVEHGRPATPRRVDPP